MNMPTRSNLSAKEALLIAAASLIMLGAVAFLFYVYSPDMPANKQIYRLPMINAGLNALTTILLIAGYRAVKARRIARHQKLMITALVSSMLFLVIYVIFHAMAPPTPYGGQGLLRYVYYILLISHIILAALITPLALITVLLAFRGRFSAHRKIARITLPLWLYVSISGLLVYLFIRPYYPV